jgi:hypothetical protein
MAFTQGMLEEVVAWCRDSLELASARRQARSRFFGDDDERPVEYWPGAGEFTSRERRFLGYFLFNWELPSGEKPAEVAVKRLQQGSVRGEALSAVRGARFVYALATSIVGRSVYLEVEKERFDVRSAQWTANLRRDTVVVAHLVPVRHGYWLPGPGWLNLPFTLGPGIRANLAAMQTDPIGIERMLQGRARAPGEPPPPEPPRDQNLEAAVARMTAWAERHGHDALVMPADDWEALVLRYIGKRTITGYYQTVLERVSEFSSEEEMQELAGLLSNVWNNTPQPDRGGKTANQMAREHS